VTVESNFREEHTNPLFHFHSPHQVPNSES